MPRLKGRLFCVHLISVSGTDPATMHVRLYCVLDENTFNLLVKLTDVGFTANKQVHRYQIPS